MVQFPLFSHRVGKRWQRFFDGEQTESASTPKRLLVPSAQERAWVERFYAGITQ
jgi:hypothetical protein